jgi:hypothetical protein
MGVEWMKYGIPTLVLGLCLVADWAWARFVEKDRGDAG